MKESQILSFSDVKNLRKFFKNTFKGSDIEIQYVIML